MGKKKIREIAGGAVLGTGMAGLAAVFMGAVDPVHVQPQAADGRIRVACIGDSITYGFFVAGQPVNSYPAQLARLLGKDYQVVNYGYTNRTAINTADHPYTKGRIYKRSLEFRPDIVLIMLGTNDTKIQNWDASAYRRDMESLADSYLQLDSHPQVMLLLPPPVFTIHGRVMWGIRPQVLEQEVIPICRSIGEAKGLPVVDTHGPFMMKRHLFVDGVHPAGKGAALIARIAYEAITENREE